MIPTTVKPMEENRNSNAISSSSSIDFISYAFLALLSCALLYLTFQEHGMSTDNLLILRNVGILWITSLFSGHLGKLVFRIPSLLVMIANGILIVNLFGTVSVSELYRDTFTSMGLALILLRSGLGMDLASLKKSSSICVKLTCLPCLVEAIVIGAFSMMVFKMNIWFGLSCGFIVAAVSPAIVSVEMLRLQSKGYGVEKGIPSLIIAAASMDDIIAIMGFSVCIGIAVKTQDSDFIHSALHGIISIVVGVLIGFINAVILSATKLWNENWKRLSIILLVSLSTMFFAKKVSYPSAGAIGSLSLGATTGWFWNKGIPEGIALAATDYTKQVEEGLSILWYFVFEPLLFGSIGFSLQFNLLPFEKLSKSACIVIVGAFFRFLTAYFVSNGTDFTRKERLFVAISWLPKATVQAALCYIPLNLISNSLSKTNPLYDEYVTWAKDITSIAILSICITAPLGLISISYFGRKLLTQG